MRVLIAGCGYVGSALAEQLVASGHVVSGLRRNVDRLPPGVRGIAANLADPQQVRDGIGDTAFDWVVYAAAADGRDELAYRRAYVEGLSHVLDVIDTPARFVFTSSTAVYGQSRGETIDEASPTEPTRFSGVIMREAEELVGAYGTESIVLRLGGIYGPTRTRLIDRVRSSDAVLPSGAQFTNRIHRDDCAGAIAHLLGVADPAPVYVGVDDEPTDMRVVLRWLAERLGCAEPPTSSEPPPDLGKRCTNACLRESGYAFRYPTFRDGYGAMLLSGE